MKEEWRDVPGYPGYTVSNIGRVGGIRKTILKPVAGSGGYLVVCLCKKGKCKTRKIHQLVAEAFIGPCPEGLERCHMNGNKEDNRLVNIQHVTHKENLFHKSLHGTDNKGERHWCAKLKEKSVLFILKNYKPRDRNSGGAALGRKFGVGRDTISHIVNGKKWKHIPRKG